MLSGVFPYMAIYKEQAKRYLKNRKDGVYEYSIIMDESICTRINLYGSGILRQDDLDRHKGGGV